MSNFDWLAGLGLDRTNLPRLPRLPLEKSGRLEPAPILDAPTAPTAPTENNEYRAEIMQQTGVKMGGQRIKSAPENDQGEAWATGFLTCWKLLNDCGMILRTAQQAGQECQGCQHMVMTVEQWPDMRRKFFIRCELGYRQMEIGYAGQRVTIAPTDCDQYKSWRAGGQT